MGDKKQKPKEKGNKGAAKEGSAPATPSIPPKGGKNKGGKK
jgi:hypothetical protein